MTCVQPPSIAHFFQVHDSHSHSELKPSDKANNEHICTFCHCKLRLSKHDDDSLPDDSLSAYNTIFSHHKAPKRHE